MRLSEYVPTVAGRSGVGTVDSLYAQVPDAVNGAIREFTQRNQAGWDWLRRTIEMAAVADQTAYPFADIAAELDINDMVDPPYPLVRVEHVLAIAENGRLQLPRLNRIDVDEHCEHGWAVDGQAVRVWPAPAGTETLEFRVVIGERTLVADDDEPLLPSLYDDAIVHLARSIMYEWKQDDERAIATRKLAEVIINRAIGFSMPGGASAPMPVRND